MSHSLSKFALAIGSVLCFAGSVQAEEITSPQVVESSGKEMFSLYYLTERAAPSNATFYEFFPCTYTPNKEIQSGIKAGFQYWADIFGKHSVNSSSVPVYVTTYAKKNADCVSLAVNEIKDRFNSDSGEFLDYASFMEMMRDTADRSDIWEKKGTFVRVGQYLGAEDPNKPENYGWAVNADTLLCDNEAQADLVGTIRHEAGHGLGISTSVSIVSDSNVKELLGKNALSDLPTVMYTDDNDRSAYYAACEGYKGQIIRVTAKDGAEVYTKSVLYIDSDYSKDKESSGLYSLKTITVEDENSFAAHLFDLNGRQAADGMLVVTPEAYAKLKETLGTAFSADNYFVLAPQSSTKPYGAYFAGDNVREVLNGAELEYAYEEADGTSDKAVGLPINGWEYNYDAMFPELSHINTEGMMSHTAYSNMTTFLEVELAVMQDMGYQIDRKDYYGSSEYRNGQTYDNYNGYYARNEDGTDWIVGQPNETALGIGFDVYGSCNTITQMADLLSVGTGSAGIRINGTENKITIAEGVTVQSDGYNGVGVLASSGSGHTLTVNGTVTAAGEKGRALVFDYGSNSTDTTYYGSFISYRREMEDGQIKGGGNYPLPSKYNGALMDKVTVSGTVRGSENAIYISKNAFVKEVEFAGRAEVAGNITSDWKDGFGDVTDLSSSIYYNLNLQYNTHDDIKPSEYVPDLVTTFSFTGDDVLYAGTIDAAKNSRIKVSRGSAFVVKDKDDASVSTLSVEVAEGATLVSNQDYALAAKSSLTPYSIYKDDYDKDTTIGAFINGGTLVVGSAEGGADAMSITGVYSQEDNAVLTMRVGGSNDSFSSLSVGQSDEPGSGTAYLAGTLSLTPVKTDYYRTGTDYTYTFGDFVNAVKLEDSMQAEVATDSPVLTMHLATTDASGRSIDALTSASDVITISYDRDYAQYAIGGNARSLAKALQGTNPYPGSAMEGLYSAIDFSADGAAVSNALDSLTPDIYGDMVQSIFTSQKHNVSFRQDAMMKSSLLKDGIYTRVQPYVMHESRKDDNHGYRVDNVGVMAELNKVDEANVYGAYAVLNKKDFKTGDKEAKATDYSLYAGADALVRPFANAFFVTADLGLGFDSIYIERSAAFNGYRGSADMRYNAYGLYGAIGTGYDFDCSVLTLTPFAKLSYNMLYQGGLTEDGEQGMELEMDPATFKSLSSSLGLRVQSESIMLKGAALTAAGSFAWKQEFLEDYGSIRASFRQAPGSSFHYKAKPYDRTSFEAMGSARISKGSFGFSTDVGVEAYQGSGNDLFARLNFEYSF